MISEKHSRAARENIQKVIASGKSIHKGKDNGRWNGGSRVIGSYPCPICGKELLREKRYSGLKCKDCGRKNRRWKHLRDVVTRSAYYWRARKIIERSGIKLTSENHVHHVDGNWQNNELENLLVTTKWEHRKLYH